MIVRLPSGVRILANVNLTERVVRRVPGGYRFRWLIRQEEVRPSRTMIFHGDSLAYAHPALIAELRRIDPRIEVIGP